MGSPVQNVIQAMSAAGLEPGTQSLKQMAIAIGPIINGLDGILVSSHLPQYFHSNLIPCAQDKLYLKNYNANLNTVPVVGLKNKQIMFIETRADTALSGGTSDSQSLVSLPPDARVNPDD